MDTGWILLGFHVILAIDRALIDTLFLGYRLHL